MEKEAKDFVEVTLKDYVNIEVEEVADMLEDALIDLYMPGCGIHQFEELDREDFNNILIEVGRFWIQRYS